MLLMEHELIELIIIFDETADKISSISHDYKLSKNLNRIFLNLQGYEAILFFATLIIIKAGLQRTLGAKSVRVH